MRVLVEEPLCQDSRGWSPIFENLSARSMWVLGYVPSCPDLSGGDHEKPGGHDTCPVPKDPRVTRRGPNGQGVGFC
jgi:hypothetical protein